MKPRVISAIVRRELAGYFSSPTGYVFITIFIFLSAFAAFWLPGFFDRNIASLDQLNTWFPALLLLLVPAITMGAWAEERRQGTEELLLTLPARDWQLALGKYLACLLIYGAALVFSLGNVAVLMFLGAPDLGLVLSTYLGYALAGAALIGVGLVASALTSNLTVAFILAAVFCGGILGVGALRFMFPGTTAGDLAMSMSLMDRFVDFGRGVVSIENVAYFLLVALLGLWATTLLISRRHWAGSRGSRMRSGLAGLRGIAWVIAAGAIVTIFSRTPLRADATAERLWSLSSETRRIIDELPAERPVLITAYVSARVPSSYIQTRDTLIGLLREIDRLGGEKIGVRLVEAEPFTEAAREARANFNIEPRPIPSGDGDAETGISQVFLGLAFTSGPEQFVLPFLSRGLSVEYELARSIRAVTLTDRKKVGIVDTELGVLGAFDFQNFTSRPQWPIVEELRKQYEVVTVQKGTAVPPDLDALIVPQPSTLTSSELVYVVDYIQTGGPTLVLEDPLPLVNPGLGTAEPRGATMNPFQRQRQPEQEPKADLGPLYNLLGINIPANRIVWDAFNPRPAMPFEREIIFVSPASGSSQAFNPEAVMTSGLQEVVMLLTGEIEPRTTTGKGASGVTVTPLMRSSPVSGTESQQEVLTRSFFGFGGLNPQRRQSRVPGERILAAHVTGSPAEGAKPINVVVLPDVDLMGPEFFALREQGNEQFNFDNVPLILNIVDTLAGDQSLVELRKRRPTYRTLERLDATRQRLSEVMNSAQDAANSKAASELAVAQASLNRKITEIEQRPDLDDTTRQIMIQSVRDAEQRKLTVQTAAINDAKDAQIADARARTMEAIDSVQNQIRFAAVMLPPIPALALGAIVFLRRRAQEREGADKDRLR
jgi:ABC-2 type transport system permease protein